MSWLVLTCSDCRAGRCVSTWEHATHVTSTSAGNFRVSDGGFVVACLGIVNCRNVAMTCNDHRPACFVWRNLLSPGGSKDSIMPPIWDAFARAVNVEEPDETTLRFPWVFIVLGIPRGPLGSASNALKARTEVLSVWVRAFTLWKSVAAKRWKNTTEKPTNVRLVDIAHTNPWDWYIHLHKNHNQSNVGKYTIHGWYGLIHMVCWNTVVERPQNTLVEWFCNHQSCEFPARVFLRYRSVDLFPSPDMRAVKVYYIKHFRSISSLLRGCLHSIPPLQLPSRSFRPSAVCRGLMAFQQLERPKRSMRGTGWRLQFGVNNVRLLLYLIMSSHCDILPDPEFIRFGIGNSAGIPKTNLLKQPPSLGPGSVIEDCQFNSWWGWKSERPEMTWSCRGAKLAD